MSCFYLVELSPRYESKHPRIIKVGKTENNANYRLVSIFNSKFDSNYYTPFLLKEISLSERLALDLELKVKRKLKEKGFLCLDNTSEYFKIKQEDINSIVEEVENIYSKLTNNTIVYKSSNLGLAQALESYRVKNNLTQEGLAKICGSTQSTVCKVLRGSRDIRISTAQKMLDPLELDFAIIKRSR